MDDQSPAAEQLARSFIAEQAVTEESARNIAEKVTTADIDISNAATYWAQNGEFPQEPEIAGQTPASLGRRLKPTLVFTALIALRENPERALATLARHTLDENDVFDAASD